MRLPSSPGEGAAVGYEAWRPGGGPGLGPGPALGLLDRGVGLADRAPDSIMDTCYMPNNPAHYGLDMFAGEGDTVPGVPSGSGAGPAGSSSLGSPEAGGGGGGAAALGPLQAVLSAGGPPSPASPYGVSLGAALSPQDVAAGSTAALHGCLTSQGVSTKGGSARPPAFCVFERRCNVARQVGKK